MLCSEIYHGLFISLGTVLCALYQTQREEIPPDIWWWALPASSRISRTTRKCESASGRICLPSDLWEISSQVRIGQAEKPNNTLGVPEPSLSATVHQYISGYLQISVKWTKDTRKSQILNTFPELTGVCSLWAMKKSQSFLGKCVHYSILERAHLQSYICLKSQLCHWFVAWT
jgi:hypothetical protein